MKKSTIAHIKFEMLGSLLELTRWETVGILETLWQFCQNHAYDGELTRFTPKTIAAWFGWKREPQLLIDALVESGWLDRTDEKLIVHDWGDHAPNWVKGALVSTLRKQIEHPELNEQSENALSATLSTPLSDTLRGKGKVRLGKEKENATRGSKTSGCSDGFAIWFDCYPKKVARNSAEKAYAKALAEIIKTEGVDSSRAAQLLLDWTNERLPALLATEDRFRPHPATWLNAGRYRDAVSVATSSQAVERTMPETKVGGYVRKPKPGRGTV